MGILQVVQGVNVIIMSFVLTEKSMVELAWEGRPGSLHGVGLDANIVTASIRAVLSGINRLMAAQAWQEQAVALSSGD